MKKYLATIVFGWFSALSLLSQVSVEVELEKKQLVANEDLRIAVHITNHSGQSLHLGADEEWLSFNCALVERGELSPNGLVSVLGEFELGTSKKATKRVDLSPAYQLSSPGRYSLVAYLKIPGWNEMIESKPVYFEVLAGTIVWEQVVGLPGEEGLAPVRRKYLIQKASFLKDIQLFFRLTDAAEVNTYKVHGLGSIPSFGEVDAKVDKGSHLHVLHQSGPRFFSYVTFDTEGSIVERSRYEAQGTRPRLELDLKGDVRVKGGQRRPAPTDITRTSALKNEGVERK